MDLVVWDNFVKKNSNLLDFHPQKTFFDISKFIWTGQSYFFLVSLSFDDTKLSLDNYVPYFDLWKQTKKTTKIKLFGLKFSMWKRIHVYKKKND